MSEIFGKGKLFAHEHSKKAGQKNSRRKRPAAWQPRDRKAIEEAAIPLGKNDFFPLTRGALLLASAMTRPENPCGTGGTVRLSRVFPNLSNTLDAASACGARAEMFAPSRSSALPAPLRPHKPANGKGPFCSSWPSPFKMYKRMRRQKPPLQNQLFSFFFKMRSGGFEGMPARLMSRSTALEVTPRIRAISA